MVIYLSLFIKIGCTQSNPLQFINIPKKSTSLSRSQAYKFDPETGRHERETAHKIPWGKNSTWGRSFMTLGLVPLCCSPGHICAVPLCCSPGHKQWQYQWEVTGAGHSQVVTLPSNSPSNKAPAWARCPADQQLLDPTYLYFLCNVVSIWIRLIFTLLVVSINLPQASYFLLNFLQSEHRGSFVFSLCEQTEGWFPFHFSIACFWAVPSWEWKWSILL